MNGKVCAITGHRDLPEAFDCNLLYDTLEELIGGGCSGFCCGMARGFDLKALDCLIELKQRYHVCVEACIPYDGQERSFPAAERKKYRDLLAWCDRKTVLYPAYFRGCFLARDRYMVDHSDLLLAYCVRESGGAAYTVKYARETGKEIIFLERDER